MIIDIPENSDFSIHNIPFGIFSTKNLSPRAGVAIGNHILDLVALSQLNVFDFDTSVFEKDTLNDFISLGKPITNKVRTSIQNWILDKNSPIADKPNLFVHQSESKMHLPIKIGDYTDFYSSLEHATNVGTMFRDKDNPLLPNWKHIPVGYHGRASSIIVSEQPIRRPKGQIMPPNSSSPIFQATQRLDFELEMAFITGKKTKIGEPISIKNAEDHIFGLVLLLLGTKLFLDSSIIFAEYFSISNYVIGLSITAIGSSLPELASAIESARRKNLDFIVGNVLGSNIFNIAIVLGIAGIINPNTLNPLTWDFFLRDMVMILLTSIGFFIIIKYYISYLNKAICVLLLVSFTISQLSLYGLNI